MQTVNAKYICFFIFLAFFYPALTLQIVMFN